MKRILICGASGFIGSHLIPFLQAKGHVVETLSRKEGSLRYWDPEKGHLPLEHLEGFDVIINLCGHSLLGGIWTKRQKEKILQSRVVSERLLTSAIDRLTNPPDVFISSSALGYYGNRHDALLTERDTSGAGFLAEVCKEWEKAVPTSVRTVFLRIGVVLAVDGGALQKMIPIFRLGLGGRLGNGNQWMSWIALTDLLRAFEFLMVSTLSGPVNCVAPNPVTNTDFTKALAKALKMPAFMHIPAFVLRLVLGEAADEMLLTSINAHPEKLLHAGFIFEDPRLEGYFAHSISSCV